MAFCKPILFRGEPVELFPSSEGIVAAGTTAGIYVHDLLKDGVKPHRINRNFATRWLALCIYSQFKAVTYAEVEEQLAQYSKAELLQAAAKALNNFNKTIGAQEYLLKRR
ncbi:hypothetical protein ACWOEH_05230 [Enterococcus nangangensis]